MIAIAVFLAVIGAIVAWWLSQQRLTAKPWLEEGALGEFPGSGVSSVPTAKIGLGVFLAVVGSLFALLISAYLVRTEIGEWRPPPAPSLLWFNTGVLAASSLALQLARTAARRGELDEVRTALLVGGLSAIVFLAGQLLAWKRLEAEGYYLASNPASSFFYLMTAAHGLHVVGGLVGLGRTGIKAWSGAAPEKLRLGVELCAIYWHFLLFVWLILLAVLMGWSQDLVVICRGWLT